MGLFRIFGGEAKDRLEEYNAKKALEKQLGRKIEDHELYSLSTNMDASDAQPTSGTPSPIASLESTTPFAQAKPPISTSFKLGGAAIILLVVLVGGGGFFILNMPEATYNRLNPFTPKPPAGAFPTAIGEYSLKEAPTYQYDVYKCDTFTSQYSARDQTVYYKIYDLKNPDAAKSFLSKNNPFASSLNFVAEETDTRKVIKYKANGAVSIMLVAGSYMITFGNKNLSGAINFENELPFAALGVTPPPKRDADAVKETPLQALGILDAFNSNAKAAEEKFHGKSFLFTATVASAGITKKGEPFIAVQKPGVKVGIDSTLVCSFIKIDAEKVAKLKVGSTVQFRGKVNLDPLVKIVTIDECTIN